MSVISDIIKLSKDLIFTHKDNGISIVECLAFLDNVVTFTYIMSFDTVVFILGIGSKGKNITSIAFETANMCLQLNTMLDKFVRPRPIEHGLGSHH
jgi:hypothetical protein